MIKEAIAAGVVTVAVVGAVTCAHFGGPAALAGFMLLFCVGFPWLSERVRRR